MRRHHYLLIHPWQTHTISTHTHTHTFIAFTLVLVTAAHGHTAANHSQPWVHHTERCLQSCSDPGIHTHTRTHTHTFRNCVHAQAVLLNVQITQPNMSLSK